MTGGHESGWIESGGDVPELPVAGCRHGGAAVSDRQRQPKEPLIAWYGSRRVIIETTELQQFFALAQRHSTHNAGARVLKGAVLDRLVEVIYDPGFGTRADIRTSLAHNDDVVLFMEQHWPVLSPEQALNDLLGSPALLASAAAKAGLGPAEIDLLAGERTPEVELGRRRPWLAEMRDVMQETRPGRFPRDPAGFDEA